MEWFKEPGRGSRLSEEEKEEGKGEEKKKEKEQHLVILPLSRHRFLCVAINPLLHLHPDRDKCKNGKAASMTRPLNGG